MVVVIPGRDHAIRALPLTVLRPDSVCVQQGLVLSNAVRRLFDGNPGRVRAVFLAIKGTEFEKVYLGSNRRRHSPSCQRPHSANSKHLGCCDCNCWSNSTIFKKKSIIA